MRLVLQRVSSGSVRVDDQIVGSIDSGLVVLVGIAEGDDETTVRKMADKTVGLRIFADEQGRMNRNLLQAEGSILAISQFTLLADCRRGRRPAFTDAAAPDDARRLYEIYVEELRRLGPRVETGIFAADMKVELVNDGPVTIVLETPPREL